MSIAAKIGRLNPAKTFFLLCDMQEKFSKSISYFDQILNAQMRILEATKLLEIPCIVTEHYPKGKRLDSVFFFFSALIFNLSEIKGLGVTVSSLKAETEKANAKVFEKTLFSMCTPELLDHLKSVRPGKRIFFLLLLFMKLPSPLFKISNKKN